MRVRTIGIDRSVAKVFDPADLAELLSDDVENAVVVDADDLGQCDGVVLLHHDDAVFDADVQWVHTVGAGVDHLPIQRYRERGVTVTNSPGVNAHAVAEHALALLLALSRSLPRALRQQVEDNWDPPEPDQFSVLGADTVCVVGLGSVGRRIARFLDALGTEVVGVRRKSESVPGVTRRYQTSELESAIRDARAVVLAVPLNDDTRGLIGADELAVMRSDAFLVNVARGSVVDEAALIEALAEDEIAGAGLDTVATEPLPQTSPLWDQENVLLTPHVAGMHETYAQSLAPVVAETADALNAGRTPDNRVV